MECEKVWDKDIQPLRQELAELHRELRKLRSEVSELRRRMERMEEQHPTY